MPDLGLRYADIIVTRRVIILCGWLAAAAALSAIGWWRYGERISARPREGFETRGTPSAARCLALNQLRSSTATPAELLTLRRFGIYRRANRFKVKVSDEPVKTFSRTPIIDVHRQLRRGTSNGFGRVVVNGVVRLADEFTFSNLAPIVRNTTVPMTTTTEKYSNPEVEGDWETSKLTRTVIFASKPADNFTIPDYNDYGIGYVPSIDDLRKSPCAEIVALGSTIPYTIIHSQAIAVFEANDVDQLFQKETLQALCKLEALAEMKESQGVLSHSLNLPHYALCLSDEPTHAYDCQQITDQIAAAFREDIRRCFGDVNNTVDLHPFCSTVIVEQLRNFIFPRGFRLNDRHPIRFSVVLKKRIYQPMNERDDVQQKIGSDFETYEALRIALTQAAAESKIRLIGFYAGGEFRDAAFERAVRADVWRCAGGAALLVTIVLWTSSGSLIYAMVVMFTVSSSLGVAFFFYTAIFSLEFLPFVAILAVIIVVAVGADAALIVAHMHRLDKAALQISTARALNIHAHYSMPPEASRRGAVATLATAGVIDAHCSPYFYAFNSPVYQHTMRNNVPTLSMRLCLQPFAATVIIAYATTAAAFLTNLTSQIIALKCFGAFAALTTLNLLIANLIVIPSALSFADDVPGICMPPAIVSRFLRVLKCSYDIFLNVCASYGPMFVSRFRQVIIFVATTSAFIAAIHLKFFATENDSISMDAMLLRANHPSEWFTQNADIYFNYSAEIRQARIYAIWGVDPISNASSFSPHLPGTLQIRDDFRLNTTGDVHDFAADVIKVSRAIQNLLPNSSASYKLSYTKADNEAVKPWLSTFIEWARQLADDEPCSMASDESIAREKEYDARQCFREYFLECGQLSTLSSARFSATAVDSPIFNSRKKGHRGLKAVETTVDFEDEMSAPPLIGYFVIVEFNLVNGLTRLSERILSVEKKLDAVLRYAPSFLAMNKDYAVTEDLQRVLTAEAPLGVAIALAACAAIVLMATRDWRLTGCLCAAILWALLHILLLLSLAGWRAGIIEAMLIVSSIGLSFDYVLHYANAFRLATNVVGVQRLTLANASAGRPLAAAALTNVGPALLLQLTAGTQPLLAAAQLLIVVTAVGLVATFIVLAALLLTFT